jgi:alpha-ketoglutarate-dependent taurine dioxygenase
VQISKLSNAGKYQLVLLVAQRKVLAFRDQDFADLPIQEALDFGDYFGRHHIHPTTGNPEGYPEIHIVHRSPTGDPNNDANQANKAIGTAWHSDVSFEDQPPGVTFLYVLDQPEIGGDTLFADGVEAYNRLSPALQERLHGLKALHSNHKAFQRIKAEGGVIRREPNAAEHPLIRTHPVTGEKALYVHGGCEWIKLQLPFTRVLLLIRLNSYSY